jgi:hypothetical protein
MNLKEPSPMSSRRLEFTAGLPHCCPEGALEIRCALRAARITPRHEPALLRLAEARSGPRLCEAQRFMAPMRGSQTVEAPP